MHDARIVREADEPGGGTSCKRVMQVRPVHAVAQDIPLPQPRCLFDENETSKLKLT
jgi:hypothetical protein